MLLNYKQDLIILPVTVVRRQSHHSCWAASTAIRVASALRMFAWHLLEKQNNQLLIKHWAGTGSSPRGRWCCDADDDYEVKVDFPALALGWVGLEGAECWQWSRFWV